MKFFYWNKNFEIGIPDVDRQHRVLVDLINGLGASITDGGKLPQVQTLLTQLADYAAGHFSEEEALLDASQLPDEEKTQHRRAHRGFIEKTEGIVQRTDLLRAEIAEELLDFLTTWLISHILGSDTKFARFLVPGIPSASPENALLEISPVERVLIRALGETERRFRLISDHAPALIWVSDAGGNRGFFNRAWNEFVGIVDDESETSDGLEFVHPDDFVAYTDLIARLHAHPESAEMEYRLRRHDGEYRWVLEKILPRIDNGDIFMGLIASATDISAIKQAEALLNQSNQELEEEVLRRTAQLEQMMLTDALTGIGNRRFLMSRLEEETVRATRHHTPLTVVFFDVDHFKRVNDTYGHAVGDVVLAGVAESLKSGLREYDIVARYGGEEFVVLLVQTGLEDGFNLAERMRATISRLQFPELPIPITVSAGLAEWQPGETTDSILHRSDQALYRAKNSGRNCCVVSPP